MLTLGDIWSLKLFGVYERGVPNREHVILRTWDSSPVQLGYFFLAVGWRSPGGNGATPLQDGLLWLGELEMRAGQWIYVYTGPGTQHVAKATTGEDLHVIHWNRSTVVFGDANTVPLLMQASSVAVGQSPQGILAETNYAAQLARLASGGQPNR